MSPRLRIDLAREITPLEGWNEPMKVFYDGMHVTDEGSMVQIDLVADTLARLIRTHIKFDSLLN